MTDTASLPATGPPPVMAADTWRTNAHLIADLVRLGYLRETDRVLDPTYGEHGGWWKLWRPAELATHHRPDDGVDFRALPHPDDSFDVVAYDPPYVCTGGRETSTLGEFNARYGLTDTPRRPGELQAMNDAGLAECARVVRRGGLILAKCADYVWSGHVVWGTDATREAALDLGLLVVDRFEHVGDSPRAQPERFYKGCPDCGTKPRKRKAGHWCPRCEALVVPIPCPSGQHHARRNLSTLFVFKKRR